MSRERSENEHMSVHDRKIGLPTAMYFGTERQKRRNGII
jgi:hypothetical protein